MKVVEVNINKLKPSQATAKQKEDLTI